MSSHLAEKKELTLQEFYCEEDGLIYTEAKHDWIICPITCMKKIYNNAEVKVKENES